MHVWKSQVCWGLGRIMSIFANFPASACSTFRTPWEPLMWCNGSAFQYQTELTGLNNIQCLCIKSLLLVVVFINPGALITTHFPIAILQAIAPLIRALPKISEEIFRSSKNIPSILFELLTSVWDLFSLRLCERTLEALLFILCHQDRRLRKQSTLSECEQIIESR